jgi:hypothetical protein
VVDWRLSPDCIPEELLGTPATARKAALRLYPVVLSDEHWDVMKSVPDLRLDSYIPIPLTFWRESLARKLEAPYPDTRVRDGMMPAIIALSERKMPIKSIKVWEIRIAINVSVDSFLGALGNIRQLKVSSLHVGVPLWERIWQSPALQKGKERLYLLGAAAVRLRNHPNKLYNLLRKHPYLCLHAGASVLD